ncbi:MAG TPA: 3,4-dihydroxy-2-butanone-4-phosphate synthase [Solirubrobacterales bacterium]|nr:3,4-dihydroxy-2-butanone-4-phosphate synthase [Solirubrobacterales bacterium]
MLDLLTPVTGLEAEPTTSVGAAVTALAAGRPVVLLHGPLVYLVAGARDLDAETVRRMATEGRGVLRVAASFGRLRELGLASREGHRHAAPVDLIGRERPEDPAGRAATVRALADPSRTRSDFRSGHVFPIAFSTAESGERPGAPEAAAELARLATGVAVAAYCEATDEPGLPPVALPGSDHGLVAVSVEAACAHAKRTEATVERLVTVALPTAAGEMSAVGFLSRRDGREYTAFFHGDPALGAVPVHVQFSCQPGDVFGAATCRCGEMLQDALARIDSTAGGVIVHVHHPDPLRHLHGGTGPVPEAATIERDLAHLLRDLGVRDGRLSCNESLDLEWVAEETSRLGTDFPYPPSKSERREIR